MYDGQLTFINNSDKSLELTEILVNCVIDEYSKLLRSVRYELILEEKMKHAFSQQIPTPKLI